MATVVKPNGQFDQITVQHREGVTLLVIHGDPGYGKSAFLKRLMGLSETLKDREEISASLPRLNAAGPLVPERPTLYYRNGILVGHTGRKITPEDVANALAEE